MFSIVKYVLVMALGYMMKKWKILSHSDIKPLSSIMMYITLPCVMAASTKALKPDHSLLVLALIAFCINALMLFLGYIIPRNKENRILFMVNLSSLNIGGFAVPFLQETLPATAIAFSGMYDMGNSAYGNGISYWVPKSVRDGDNGLQIKKILQRLCRSVPLITYIVFLILAFANIRLPETFFQIVQEIGNCNFLIVFLIAGIVIDLRIDREGIKTVLKFLLMKYGIGAILSLLIYFFLPLDLMIRQVMIVCLLSPQASTSIAYCEMLDCNPKVSSTIYSCGILASLCAYFILGMIWNI